MPVPAFLFRLMLLLAAAGAGLAASGGAAQEQGRALVAVAANFSETAEELARAFEATGNGKVRLATGSTGQLYAQILGGAPFDLFLAADRARPQKLEENGRAVAGSRITYALGQLVLWSADPDRIGADGKQAVAARSYTHLALANPKLAPYGRAARQALERLGLAAAVRGRIVQGQNVGQAFALVATGNAALGLVARSQVISPRNTVKGSLWAVPREAYDPIRQDAVLLAHGAGNAAARAFMDFLRGPEARQIIRRHGYRLEGSP